MKTIRLIILLALSTNLFAQRSEVTLNNGSVILGKVKTVNDTIVNIATKDGSVWQYHKNEIKSIEPYDYSNNNGKMYSIVAIGFMPALQISKSFHIINGYKFNKHWQAGVGLGLEDIANKGYIPLTLHGQYNLLKKNSTPFISVMAGYEMAMSQTIYDKGAFTTGLQVGFNHFFSEHIGLTTSIGYRYGYFKSIQPSWGWEPISETITIREINRFEFRFGLVFK